MVISAEASSRPPPDPSSPQPVAPPAPSSRRESTQGHLHDFSFPSLKPWAKHRVFRCANVNGKGEIVSGRMESSEVSGTARIPALVCGGGRGGDDSGLEEVREKLMIHLREAADRMNLVVPPASPSPSPTPAAPKGAEAKRTEEAGVEGETVSARPWNLRKRRGSAKVTMGIDRYLGGGWSPEKRTVRLRSEDGERPKFSITLTKEEIEEDVYAVTGRRARRRPRRRPRVIQKQLDALFPGSWLSEITVDTYKVPEPR